MRGFDTILIVDWSAGKRAPKRPSKDAIWLGITRQGISQDPIYCRNRIDAEAAISRIMDEEMSAGRRLLAGFDFPFGYPRGFAERVTGSNDPLVLWDWFEARVQDAEDGANNRFEIAEELNALFDGPGPFWGKPHQDRWPNVPYRKAGIRFDEVAEKRACDAVAKAASSCFQLSFPPTVGGQIIMGLPVLARLRRRGGVAVWPFEAWRGAPVVLAEIWPGLIEDALPASSDDIRDRAQVRLLADALARMPVEELATLLDAPPSAAQDEAWILGADQRARLAELAMAPRVPPLKNDCFSLPPGVHWTSVDAALELLRDRLSTVVDTAEVTLKHSLGRVSSSNVYALRSNPPLPNTAVDGYGFSGAKAQGVHRLPLAEGRAAAGDAPERISQGQAIRVLTGAALPEGVDTVVLQEDCVVEGDHVSFRGPVKHGANTRAAGEDMETGDTVLQSGQRVGPADLALLAATGVHKINVFKSLRVGVLSTGDELVAPGEPAGAGQIFDANRPMLLGLIEGFGHVPVDLGHAPDDRAALRAMLDAGARQVDAILTSGGASAGDEDHVSALLSETGSMALWRIAIKPGRPLALGMWHDVPVFGLPGNPVAAMVCALIFTHSALAAMAGQDWHVRQGFSVPAAFSKRKKEGRREFLRARIKDGKAEVFASEGSGRISGLAWADGLVELPDHAHDIAPGDLVRYIPFSSFFV